MDAKKATHPTRQTSGARQDLYSQGEPILSSDNSEYQMNQRVVHPTHGAGKIIARETQVIAGKPIELLVINFPDQEMVLRFPVEKIPSSGLRRLAEPQAAANQTEALPATQRFSEPFESIAPLVPAARANPDIFAQLLQDGFAEEELFLLVIPKRTLARRRAAKEFLTVEETDKAFRLMRIAEQARLVFGEPAKAHRWLRKSKRELSGQTPLVFLSSEAGARVVEEMLHRIDHGIFA